MNTTHTRALSSSSLNGTDVVNPQGEDLGHVEDLMIDLNTGRVLYTVLSFGGILGIGNKLFAVPFQAFTVNQDDENFILNMDKERLKNAPGFDKESWPATDDMDFQTSVYRYYNIEPYWTAVPTL